MLIFVSSDNRNSWW